jgi:hypothetical protein
MRGFRNRDRRCRADAVERIVFPRLSRLHRIGAARQGGDGIAA